MVSREHRLTRLVLKKLGIDWEKKTYNEFYLIEYGEDKRPNISKLLKICGGKPSNCSLEDYETRSSGSGQPEIIIEVKKKGVVLIVECKSDKDKHRTAELNKPASHNLDGVLYYAKYFKESFTVLFLAITGDAEKEKEWLISFGVWKQGLKDHQQVINKIIAENTLLPWQSYLERLTEEKVDLRSITKDLHNRLRVIKFGNKAKPLFIGACLLALRDDDFYKKVAEANFDKEEDIPNLLKNALNSKKSLGLKEYSRLKKKLQELIDSNSHLLIKQKKKEHRLSSILKKIQEEVYPLLKTSSTDIISEFYYEFLRYSPGDGKGLGIVLTPSHIAELFCDLVNLGSDDKILDICCGTGTFLVMALNKVFKKEEIKDNLYGVESDDEIYHLLWINMILHGDGSSHIFQTSCFDENKKTEGQTMIEPILEKVGFTVGFLNPPYSQPDYNEAKFILHLLKFIEKGRKAIVITHMKVARGTKPLEKERKELLENHTLKAVMTMPGDLFYGTQSQPPTVIMVWVAKQPHQGKTWLASWKDDGYEIKDNKREEREKGSWEKTKKQWLENYKQEKEEEYISTSQLFTPEQSKKSWLPEFYLPVNFSKVKEEQFIESVRDYLGYIMAISKGIDNLSTSLPKLFEELENNHPTDFSLNIEKWKEFKLVSNYNQDEENSTGKKGLFHAEPAPEEDNFRTKSAKPYFQDLKLTIPLISNSGKNNGCVGFVEKIILEIPAKGGCITLGGFGTFFYQPIDFYRTYAQDGNVWVLRAEWLNEKRGLFLASLLTNAYAEKFHYGYRTNEKVISDLRVKLPVKENWEIDWELMEKYIEYIVNRLSLSLSLWKSSFYKN